MNYRFAEIVEKLEAKYQELLAMPTVAASDVPSGTPDGGVYLFSEDHVHLYVGRTKREIHKRIREHFGKKCECSVFPVAHCS